MRDEVRENKEKKAKDTGLKITEDDEQQERKRKKMEKQE